MPRDSWQANIDKAPSCPFKEFQGWRPTGFSQSRLWRSGNCFLVSNHRILLIWLNRISSCLCYSKVWRNRSPTYSFKKMISNCLKEIVIESLLVFPFRLKYHNCFKLLWSVYFPPLALFLFLFLGLISVAPWHCPFKIGRMKWTQLGPIVTNVEC